jgi:transposase
LTILLETGEIARFPSVRNYVSYARLVRTERRSNGRTKGQANRRNGNPYLSWAYTEAAHFAYRFQPEARRFYDRKRARTNGIVAIRALAHKLARACFFILRDRVPYDPAMLFRS